MIIIYFKNLDNLQKQKNNMIIIYFNILDNLQNI